MLNSKQIRSILEGLEGEEEKFISIFDRIVKAVLRVQQNSEELLEEFQRLFKNYDSVFQFTIIDFNFSFFLKISKGEMTYDEGIFQETDIPVVTIEFPKAIILQVLKQEMSVESLYNKGIINIKGSLSKVMRLRALATCYLKYIDKVFRNKVTS